MSADTLTHPKLADDDGSGKDSDWKKWSASMDGTEEYPDQGYVMRDVGRRIFTGRTAVAGFAEDFHTDRVMPMRAVGKFITQLYVGPENHLG
jgi:hypothetical protein